MPELDIWEEIPLPTDTDTDAPPAPEDNICSYCFNAYVASKYPSDDPFETELDDSNDFGSCGIGDYLDSYSIMFNSGAGRPCELEFRNWYNGRWHTVGRYYPKFCPECGRPLTEYSISDNGDKFERIHK